MSNIILLYQISTELPMIADLEIYKTDLLKQYPSIEFWKLLPNSNMAVQWELPGGTLGSLDENLQALGFCPGLVDEFIDCVLWHRRYISPDISIAISDDVDAIELILTMNIKREDILSFFE